jgi:acyl dehydratase
VFLGDTVTIVYTVRDIDEARLRTTAQIEVKNQHGDVVTVGEHIMKWVPRNSVDQ